MFFAFFQTAQAQNFVEPSVIVNGRVYICEKSNDGKIMWIHNENFETTTPPTPWGYHPDCQMPTLNHPLIEQKIKEVFTSHRYFQLQNEKIINHSGGMIHFYVVPSTGQIVSVRFILDQNSSLTREEIYQLEDKIKSINLPQPTICYSNNLLEGQHPIIW